MQPVHGLPSEREGRAIARPRVLLASNLRPRTDVMPPCNRVVVTATTVAVNP